MVDERVTDRITGTFLASACANALGGSGIGLNFKQIALQSGPSGLRDFSAGFARSFLPEHSPGNVLSDTYLALDLAESICDHNGKLDEPDLRDRYRRLLTNPDFLVSAPGAFCLSGLRRMADNVPKEPEGSLEATHDYGAVRAYPIGCLPKWCNPVDLAVRQAKLSQSDTRVQAASAVIVDSIAELIAGRVLESAENVVQLVHREFEVAAKIDPRFAESWDGVAPDLDYTTPASRLPYSLLNIGSDVSESVPTAFGIFLIFRHNLEEAICAAASAGGDTDTIAAIVGALSGAYHGASQVPQRWLSKLKQREPVEQAASKVIRLWQ